MPSTYDGAAVERLFDAGTFARGRQYASRGAVLDHHHDPVEDVLTGEVRGSAFVPYEVEVHLRRTSAGAPSSIDGRCSCPVGFNCKHVVAVLLAHWADGDAGWRGGRGVTKVVQPRLRLVHGTAGANAPKARISALPNSVTARRAAVAPDWQRPLARLIAGLERSEQPPEPDVALQFEMTSQGSSRREGTATATGGIRIRPVVPGARGKWVRTGISWSRLEYHNDGRAGIGAERMALLKELLGMSRLSGPASYQHYYRYSSSSEPPMCLEDFSSRRLWDLLRHARELSIPLVLGDGTSGEVRLLDAPAVVGADVTKSGSDLLMRARIDADGGHAPLHDSLMIGRPPHGLAWCRETSAGTVELVLGRFARPLSDGECVLLDSGDLVVPRRHREAFLGEFYPRLVHSVPVSSSDDSVDLPEIPPVVLVLRVRHLDRGAIVSWSRGIEGSSAGDDLRPDRFGRMEPEVEDAMSTAIEIVRFLPALIEQSWRGDRLAAYAELSGMDAVRFVTEALPVLVGVPGLVVEELGESPEFREAVAAPVVSLRSVGRRGFDGDWFDLAVEVSVDGETVVFHDLFVALAEGQSHLVLPSGVYFSLDRPELGELATLIAEARAMSDREPSKVEGLRVSRYQAGLWEDLRRLGVDTTQATAWEGAVAALASAGTGTGTGAEVADGMQVAVPDEMDAVLRPYQEEGFGWLSFLYRHRLGGILADDMGLGKTLQALSLVCHARSALGVEEPFLVIAPTSVVENWASECRRFAPDLSVVTVSETEVRRWLPLAELADKADLVITSYTLFRMDYPLYERIAWAGLFLDEAQFVKNARAVAHQRAKALPAPFKLAMTGTPMENNLGELWALLSITAPGLFPRADRFREHFAIPIERHGDSEQLAKLRRRIRPLMLRRTKEQVASDLPDKQEQVLELELSPKHRRVYQTHLQRERQKVLGLLGDLQKNRFEILKSLTLLRQAALDIALVDAHCGDVPSTKLDALSEMLEEIVADGHRVLVFSQFTRFLRSAQRRVADAGIEHCYLDGRTRQRAKVIGAFRGGEVPVFFISLKAGGFGLNLTEADYCILLDPWWNPATEAQAVDRAHRIGQTRKVMVYRLVAKDTIEEKVMALKEKKAALFASVMDAGGFENAALSAADIRALLE